MEYTILEACEYYINETIFVSYSIRQVKISVPKKDMFKIVTEPTFTLVRSRTWNL